MPSRSARAQIAQKTVDILNAGFYETPANRRIEIGPQLDSARTGTVLYSPSDAERLRTARDSRLAELQEEPRVQIEVTNETTLHAAARLIGEKPDWNVAALNFASARNPGGGFLNGSQAQEESLSRASGLYACLNPQQGYYEANRACRTCLYTDHLIYSPRIPVFRDDHDRLLDTPYSLSIITSPAVNAGAVRKNEPGNVERIDAVMRNRIGQVLSVALVHGHRAILLGAWGCGVFQNDPKQVAAWFAEFLASDGLFSRAFQRVIFAVLDHSSSLATLRPFQEAFQTPTVPPR